MTFTKYKHYTINKSTTIFLYGHVNSTGHNFSFSRGKKIYICFHLWFRSREKIIKQLNILVEKYFICCVPYIILYSALSPLFVINNRKKILRFVSHTVSQNIRFFFSHLEFCANVFYLNLFFRNQAVHNDENDEKN